MKIIHIPSIFEGGLRKAVMLYADSGNWRYVSEVWVRGSASEKRLTDDHNAQTTLKKLSFFPALLINAGSCGDVGAVHHHGCWSLTSLVAWKMKKECGIPFIYSPHGAFVKSSLQRLWLPKKIFLAGFESFILKEVDCFHAVSEEEARHIKKLGFDKPVAVISTGIDLKNIPLQVRNSGFFGRWRVPEDSCKILFLSRIVPDKGLDILLRALAIATSDGTKLFCIVAGEGKKSYLKWLRNLTSELGLEDRVAFVGALYGEEKFMAMRNADIFILPSRNEAQGLVVMEALSQQTPVIVSQNTPYENVARRGCGWSVEASPEGFAFAMRKAVELGAEGRREIGLGGRQLLADEYSPNRMYEKFERLYQWLSSDQITATPEFVM